MLCVFWLAACGPTTAPNGAPSAPSCPDGMVRIASVPGLCMDVTEVTAAEYELCVREGACRASGPELVVAYPGIETTGWAEECNSIHPDRAEHPANCLGWTEADAYCRWAGVRLPTPTEWRDAARGGDERPYPWGWDPPSPLRVNAVGGDRNDRGLRPATRLYEELDGFAATAPVGSFPAGASPDGVLDMSGNVWEWTAPRDGAIGGPAIGEPDHEYGVAGGSWATAHADSLRSDGRGVGGPIGSMTGFRCAATAE